MIRTPNLDLPIYDKPDIDVFDMQEWNGANETIDGAYKEIVDFRENIPKVNANAEVIEARKGEATLKSKIDKIDSSLVLINTNKVSKGGNEEVTYGMLSQEVKLKFTGDKIPIVDVDSVNTINIVDNANTLNKLDRNIIEFLYNDNVLNIFDARKITNGMVFDSTTGELKSASTGCYSDYIPVIEGVSLIKNGTFAMETVFYDGNKVKLANNFVQTVRNMTFIVPTGAKYMRISTSQTNIFNLMILTSNEITNEYIGYLKGWNKTKKNSLFDINNLNRITDNELITNMFDKNANDIILGQYYNENGVLASASSHMSSGLIRVREGMDIIKTGTYTSVVTYWSKEKVYLNSVKITNKSTKVPVGAYYCRVSLAQTYRDVFMLINNNFMIDGYLTYNKSVVKYTNKNWIGKKMCTIGHSLTQMERWQPTVVNELGLNGYVSLATYGGYMINQICYNIADVPQDCDLITFWVGTNDYANNKLLGAISDIDEKTTYYGALKYVIQYASTNFTNKRLMFITDWQRDDNADKNFATLNGVDKYGNAKNNNGNTLLDFVNAVIEVCGLYGIPVYDAYRNSGVNKYNLDSYSDDRLHPSITGGVYMGKKIAKFIESI